MLDSDQERRESVPLYHFAYISSPEWPPIVRRPSCAVSSTGTDYHAIMLSLPSPRGHLTTRSCLTVTLDSVTIHKMAMNRSVGKSVQIPECPSGASIIDV